MRRWLNGAHLPDAQVHTYFSGGGDGVDLNAMCVNGVCEWCFNGAVSSAADKCIDWDCFRFC